MDERNLNSDRNDFKGDARLTKLTHEVPGAVAASPAVQSEFARGSVLRAIVRMGLPSTIGFMSMNVYDLVDMFWVAKLGTQYVAAIALFEGFYWALTSTNDIAGLGSIAVISRRYGEGKLARTAAAIKETFILKVICAIVSGVFGYIFMPDLMRLMGAEGEVIDLGVQYGRVHMVALSLYFCCFSVFTSLRSIDAPRTAMWLMIFGAALNTALDPFLIFGIGPFPELGIAGAALASAVSFGVTFMIGLYVFFSGRAPVRLRWKGEVSVRLETSLHMMRIGLPGAVNTISFSVARAVITPLVAVFGTVVVAAYGVGSRITLVGVFLALGLGMGVSPLIGNLMGAGLVQRVKKTAYQSLWMGLIAMLFLAAFIFAFAPQIILVFFKDDNLLSIGVELLRIWALGLPFIGVWIIGESVFHGAGDNVPPMLISIVTSWGIEIPLIVALTTGLGFDQTAVWWARFAYLVLGAMTTYVWLRRGRWLEKKV